MCNCRNIVLSVLHITAFLTVYFSNIISSQLAFLLGHSCDLRLFRRLLLFPKNSTWSPFSGALVFLEPVFAGLLSRSPQERAYLSYHTTGSLSSVFFDFFKSFSTHSAPLAQLVYLSTSFSHCQVLF